LIDGLAGEAEFFFRLLLGLLGFLRALFGYLTGGALFTIGQDSVSST
jgi:hypothetical protein